MSKTPRRLDCAGIQNRLEQQDEGGQAADRVRVLRGRLVQGLVQDPLG